MSTIGFQQNSKPANKKRDRKKVAKWVGGVTAALVAVAGVNALVNQTTWDEYHLEPSRIDNHSQFEYWETYPALARDYGPATSSSNWTSGGNFTGTYALTGDNSDLGTLTFCAAEIEGMPSSNNIDDLEVILWYGMEFRDSNWVMTASLYKPFDGRDMRLVECSLRGTGSPKIEEINGL